MTIRHLRRAEKAALDAAAAILVPLGFEMSFDHVGGKHAQVVARRGDMQRRHAIPRGGALCDVAEARYAKKWATKVARECI